VSDEQGQIRIGPLPPRQPLVFELSWICKAMVVEDVWEELGEIAPEPGETYELPDLVLNPAGRVLAGRVCDADGEPVSGATVFSPHGIFTKTLTTSDEDGRFQLEGLRAHGEVGVVALIDEGLMAAAVRCDPDDWPQVPRTRPAPGEPTELELVLTLEPLAALAGEVVDLNGELAAGAEVQVTTYRIQDSPVLPRQIRLHATTLTTPEGTWHVEGLIAGLEYRVCAYDPAERDPGMPEKIVPSSAETQWLRLRKR
jgi:hypothetical protein